MFQPDLTKVTNIKTVPSVVTFYNRHDNEPVAEQPVTITYFNDSDGLPYENSVEDAVEATARAVWPEASRVLAWHEEGIDGPELVSVAVTCDGRRTWWPVTVTRQRVAARAAPGTQDAWLGFFHERSSTQ